MIADDIDDGNIGPAGVVKIGKPVGQTRPQMQQRARRPAGHPPVAIGGTGHHALEQAEDAAHPLHPVEGSHEMHLRGAGIGEAHIDATGDQGADETFSSVHGIHLR